MEMKIKHREISRRTYIILFCVLPVFLWFAGTCAQIIARIGLFGTIFYLPLIMNLIVSWFFKSEKQTSLLEKIPEKVKNTSLVIILIMVLGGGPLLGIYSIIDFGKIPYDFMLRSDTGSLVFGSMILFCSGSMWLLVLYAFDAFSTIRFYFFRWALPTISVVLGLFLFWTWIKTDEWIYCIMGIFAYLLSISVAKSRSCYC